MRHAPHVQGAGYTLCGLDVNGVSDCGENTFEVPPPIVAQPREKVECLDCRRIIEFCKSNFGAGFRVSPP